MSQYLWELLMIRYIISFLLMFRKTQKKAVVINGYHTIVYLNYKKLFGKHYFMPTDILGTLPENEKGD